MAWTYVGANGSGYQNDMAVQARLYYQNVNASARTIDVLAECYLVTINGRLIDASFTGAALIGDWGGDSTRQFAVGANSTTLYTSFQRDNLSYDANGELSFPWGAQLKTNNVIAFDQIVTQSWSAPSIAPLALTSLSVSRVSDTQHNLSWSIPAGVTNTEVVVQRRTNDGAWVQVGRPAGNVSSWSDTTTAADRKFEYRVAGVRNGRQAAWVAASAVYTTPAPVASVAAEKVGTNISVSVSGLPPYATAYDVYDSPNGGAWVEVGSDVTSFPWTHTSPNSGQTHTYRVVSKRGALESAASSSSDTVQLLAKPNQPSNLAPNGGTVAAGTVRFSWLHNPVDTTAQQAYSLRYRLVGAGGWTTVTGTTPEFRDVSLTANATDYEWQVSTKGEHASYSDYSAVATVSVISVPGVAVNQPDEDWDQPILTVEWSYTQAQSRPQSSWRARLLDAASNLLEARDGSGAAGTTTFDYRLVTGETYTVEVEAAAGTVWSAVASETFDTLFVPPADPVVSGGWGESDGSVTLTVEDGGGSPAAVSMLVERSVDDGDTWELVLSTDPGQTFSDWQSLSYGVTLYRVTAVASTGAASSVVYPVAADSLAVWLGGGAGFSETARLPFDPSVSITGGRARTAKQYAGRSLPVIYAGTALSRLVSVSGRTSDHALSGEESAAVDRLVEIAQLRTATHLLRDPDGRRVEGMLSEAQLKRSMVADDPSGWNGVWGYSFSLREAGRS